MSAASRITLFLIAFGVFSADGADATLCALVDDARQRQLDG